MKFKVTIKVNEGIRMAKRNGDEKMVSVKVKNNGGGATLTTGWYNYSYSIW